MHYYVVFSVTLRLFVVNISSSSPAINKLRRLLPAISVTTCGIVVRRRRVYNTWPVAVLTACSEARYRLRITISAYPTCIRRPRYGGSRRNIAMPFGREKLEWCGYPIMWKNCEDMFICFDRMYDCDGQTDTAWWLRPRLLDKSLTLLIR